MIHFERDGSFTIVHRDCSESSIQWNHVDGPLLIRCDGQPHWLTWRERLFLWLGFTDARRLDPSYPGEQNG
jgi:hypothetical protein